MNNLISKFWLFERGFQLANDSNLYFPFDLSLLSPLPFVHTESSCHEVGVPKHMDDRLLQYHVALHVNRNFTADGALQFGS